MMTKRQRQLKPDPLKIPDPTELIPRMGGGERASSTNGMTFNASTAASVSAQGAMEPAVTVTPPAPNGHTGNVNAKGSTPKPNAAGGVDSASTKPNATLTHCEQCGREFVAHRPWARFCNAYCRRRAWLDRNPERAAELHERDIARLREHVIGNGGEWVEGGKVR